MLGAGAHAAPAEQPQQEQSLADYIKDGLKDKSAEPKTAEAVAASEGSVSSDTEGFGPAQNTFVEAFAYGAAHPDVAPPGANDWSCKPTEAHPEPVVLVHGTWENAYNNFAAISQPIKDAGYCVFTFNYGKLSIDQGGGVGSLLPGANGTGYIEESSKQLATFVDRVLDATTAAKVNIVGHSQGGPMSLWYLENEGGAAKVHHEITFGGTNHGTTLAGIGALGRAINNLGIDILGPVELLVGHAGIQQTVGSDFINALTANGDTVPGVDYTIVGSRYDEVTTPYDSTFLEAGEGATVKNITLQDGCETDLAEHLGLMYSKRSLSIILNTLDPEQTPDLTC
ncbi:alpha/beta fold hydrolase [Nocardia callitridis]|uniref:Alpha/beta fold hydrolase n=1 Tax=Nocardia callitridis TaxID=648753 RepID=A0ABP9KQ90_9NOCA